LRDERAGSAAGVLPVQFGLEQVHGLEEGLLLAGPPRICSSAKLF
jgi:hypothetical protein